MMEAYGRTVAAERRTRHGTEQLAAYARREYGHGTEVGYFLAEAEASASRQHVREDAGRRRRRGAGVLANAVARLLGRRQARALD